jgi:hypothetical protein
LADAPHFSLSPAALSAAAAAPHPPEGTDIDRLEVQESYEFDADGGDRYTQYLVYKILTPAGAENWKALSIEWAPWRDSKPAIRARVVAADGTSYPLDPSTITDSPAHSGESDIYSDMRSLRAPLPAIAPGAVVESEIVLTEKPLFKGSGKVGRSYFRMSQPIEHQRLVLQAPENLPLRYRADLLPGLSPSVTHANGTARLVFDSGPTPAAEPEEAGLPGDVYAEPVLTFSGGSASWQELARAYSQIVAARLAEADVQALTARVTAGRATREAKVSAILEYLSREIHYTGLEFGQASVVPHPIAETLAHRYGDCKDKSLLLVAMLRVAAIPASLALLNASDQLDIPDDIPGMGLFTHAIVMVPGDPVLWIDATDETARLGELPDDDRGRSALVIDPGTTALRRIDEARSTDNVDYQEREIRLADNGPAYVVETSWPRGTFESTYRREFADLEDKATRDNLTDYVKGEYLAERLEKRSHSDSKDFSQPFRLTVEGARAARARTDVSDAVAYIRIDGLFNGLPRELRTRERTEEENARATRPTKKRLADYLLARPSVTEWHYRIVRPDGFVAEALPANLEVAAGPARLTEQFSVDPDGSVRALLRFDTVQRRFTPAEQASLRDKVAELLRGDAVKIKFDLEAHRLLAGGHARESFDAYRAAVAQRPGDPIRHLHRAAALLEAGMGEAARAEAQVAVKLDPKSAFAQVQLANVLQSDLVGRWHRAGADFTGAAAAYRAAIALDSADKEPVGNLAILLEYDNYGLRYGRGADLQGALATYGKLSAPQLADLGIAANPALAMFYAREFDKSLQAAKALEAPPPNLILACEAVLHGAPAAIEQAHRLSDGDERQKEMLTGAGRMLMHVRDYPTAAAMLEAGASGTSTARTMGLVALLRQARRHEDLTFPDDAEGFVRSVFAAVAGASGGGDPLAALESRNARLDAAALTPEERDKRTHALGILPTLGARSGIPVDTLIDIGLQAMRIKTDGNDATGYREFVRSPNAHDETYFIVREAGQLRVLATLDPPSPVALEVLERTGHGDLAGARALLNWVREASDTAAGEDPYAGDPFVRLWPAADTASDAATITAAAAGLLVKTPHSARRGVELLEQARAAGGGSRGDALDLALLAGYEQLHDHEHALTVAQGLAARAPDSRRAFQSRVFHLRAVQRFAEATDLAEQRLRAHPDDVDALRALEQNLAARHDYAAAYQQGLKVVASTGAGAGDLNDLAWLSLYFDRSGGPDVDSALRALQEQPNQLPALHTLGSLYAEVGKTREAREVLLQSMDGRFLTEPESEFWYAFGRIAEQFGEREIALADYARVKPAPDPALDYSSTYRLARNRVAALRGTKQPP